MSQHQHCGLARQPRGSGEGGGKQLFREADLYTKGKVTDFSGRVGKELVRQDCHARSRVVGDATTVSSPWTLRETSGKVVQNLVRQDCHARVTGNRPADSHTVLALIAPRDRW